MVGLDNFRGDQKLASLFEQVLIEVRFLADPIHIRHVGKTVVLGRNPTGEKHCRDSPEPILGIRIGARGAILERSLERQGLLALDKIPNGRGEGFFMFHFQHVRIHDV